MLKALLPFGDVTGQGLYSRILSIGLFAPPTRVARVMGGNPTSFGPFPG